MILISSFIVKRILEGKDIRSTISESTMIDYRDYEGVDKNLKKVNNFLNNIFTGPNKILNYRRGLVTHCGYDLTNYYRNKKLDFSNFFHDWVTIRDNTMKIKLKDSSTAQDILNKLYLLSNEFEIEFRREPSTSGNSIIFVLELE